MSKSDVANDAMWWVESKGYKEELKLNAKIYEAKRSLEKVLRHYDVDVTLYPGMDWERVLCPFHDDRHASASTNFKWFRCHACERHGSAIDLVMEEERLDFAKAVDFIVGL